MRPTTVITARTRSERCAKINSDAVSLHLRLELRLKIGTSAICRSRPSTGSRLPGCSKMAFAVFPYRIAACRVPNVLQMFSAATTRSFSE